MAIKRVTVLGAGQMGNGIAQVAATSGYDVILQSRSEESTARGMEKIRGSLARFVKSGKMDQEKADSIANSIKTTTSVEDAVKQADFVFESVPEVLELKQELYARMDKVAPAHTILATNTSQLSPTAIGKTTKRQDKVIGTHWFNPPPIMRLVEVVRALDTSDETVQITVDLCRSFGKEIVVCRRDTEGFIVTRGLLAQRAEAFRMLEEGIASVEEIDRAIELGLNHPMGPFKLADFTGLDTVLHNMEYMQEAFGDRFRPTSTVRNLVNAGQLGRKVGRGFYDWSSGEPKPRF